MLFEKYIPISWRTAKIIAILNQEKTYNLFPSNYRLIGLANFSLCFKLAEKIVLK